MVQPATSQARDGSSVAFRSLLTLLGVATFFQGYAAALPVRVAGDAARSFGLSADDVGGALFLIAVGSIAALLVAPLSDRFGRRGVLVWSTLLIGVFSALTATSLNLFLFGLWSLVARVFIVAQYAAVITMLAEESPAKQRGWAIGVVTAAGGLGGICLVLVDRWIGGPGAGWRLVAVTPLVAALVALWMRTRLPESKKWLVVEERVRLTQRRIPLFRRNPGQLFQVGFLFLLVDAAFFGGAAWWGRYALDELKFTQGSVEAVVSVSYGLGIAGYLFGGWVSDRVGRRTSGTYLLFAAGILGILAFENSSSVLQAPLTVLATFCGLAASPIISAMSAELFALETRTTSVAFVRGVFGTAGGLIGPLFVGFLADESVDIVGNIGDSVSLVALALIPAILLLRYLPESAGRDLASLSAAARIPAPEASFVMQLQGQGHPAPRASSAAEGQHGHDPPPDPIQRPPHQT